MNPIFFAHCHDAEAVKEEYRRLCKRHHPDLGTPEEREERTRFMQDINAAYAQASAVYRQEDMRQRARAKGRPEPTARDYADAAATDERIREAIEKIITLHEIEIEICGLWVWVSGETKANKDALKAAGYQFAPKKVKWYFAGVPSAGRGRFSMDDIRERYGSQRVPTRTRYAPATTEA